MNQKYFLTAITNYNEYKEIPELDNTKLTGKKAVDIYTSDKTYNELVKKIEKEYNIKVKDLRLKYNDPDKDNIYYYGIITNRKSYKECLLDLKKSRKGEKIKLNKNFFIKECDDFEKTIKKDITIIEKIFGRKSTLYAQAVNYKTNESFSNQDREDLLEEFSVYYNFRKWLTRNTKPLKQKKEEYRQMHINDYINENNENNDTILRPLPRPQEEYRQMHINDYLNQEEQHENKYLNKKKSLENLKEELQAYNRIFEFEDTDKEEFLELDDYKGNYQDNVGSWQINQRKRKK